LNVPIVIIELGQIKGDGSTLERHRLYRTSSMGITKSY
jgi:hypothetical protein